MVKILLWNGELDIVAIFEVIYYYVYGTKWYYEGYSFVK